MTQAKYNPPSPRVLGVQAYINKYWLPRKENGRRYGYKDFVWFVEQGLNMIDIARAFGFKSAKPAVDMVKLYREENLRG
jgi:hypothetical protein